MLKILPASEPLLVDRLTVTIYGQPGVGKTSLAFTADSPLLLDFDKGAYRAVGRKDTVQAGSWEDVTGITADDLRPYNTVIVDTAGRALDMLSADIIKREPKMGRAGALTLQGYGRLKSEFSAWLKSLHVFGKDVVLIAHGTEQKNGDDTVMRLDVQGGSKDEIYKSADVMGWLYILNGKRTLNFNPGDAAYGKNPGNLPIITMEQDDTTVLARLIAESKQAINNKSAVSQAEFERVEALKNELSSLKDPEAIQAKVDAMLAGKAPVKDKALLAARAKECGFSIGKDGKVLPLEEVAA